MADTTKIKGVIVALIFVAIILLPICYVVYKEFVANPSPHTEKVSTPDTTQGI